MAEQIIDGSGSGYRAKVNAENQLSVIAAGFSFSHHIAYKHRKTFSLTAQQTPAAANNAFVYLENNDAEDVNIWDIELRCASVEAIEIWSVTGTAVGTAYVPVNVTVGSGIQADSTCKVGNSITGLTKVALIKRYWLEAGKPRYIEIASALIIPQSHAIALYAVTGTALTDVGVLFDFHSVE